MNSISINHILNSDKHLNKNVSISGWVRTFRANRFIALNDGSCLNNIQCVVDFEKTEQEILKKITTGAALNIKGKVVESQGSQQSIEIMVDKCEILGGSNPEMYPIQPKKHSFEFLRENAHLRTRTNTFSAVMRIRSNLSFAIHEYFKKNGFYYVHTPIITASDAEGAGEQFRVSTLDIKNPPLNDNGQVDFNKDFFGKETNLTVSGQLEAEAYAMSMGKVYTFGPTFRAENSNTSKHLAEFWMIEPEMAYCDLFGDMDLAEEMIQYLVKDIMSNCSEDLELFSKFVDKELINRLNSVSENKFERISYTEAIKILEDSKKTFEHPIEWGVNLQTEHERFLTEEHVKGPVTVFNYPKSIKPFYMRANDDGKTSAAMDLLVPGIGEIIGGSQREERLAVSYTHLTLPTSDLV